MKITLPQYGFSDLKLRYLSNYKIRINKEKTF